MKATKITLILTAFIVFMGCKNLHPQPEQGTSSSNAPEAWEKEFYEAVDNNNLSIVRRTLKKRNKEELQAVLNEPFQSTALNRKAYPLHVAAGRGYDQLVSLLLDNGADPYAETENSKFTPLHLAVRHKHANVVDLLLTKEAKGVMRIDYESATNPPPTVPKDILTNVNAKDTNGLTPLHWAAKEGYEKIAKLLLFNARTDRTIRDDHGRTAGQLAQGEHNPHIVKLFEDPTTIPDCRRLYLDGAKECDEHCPNCPNIGIFRCVNLDCTCFNAPCSFICKTLCCAWSCCCPPKEGPVHPAPSGSSATTTPLLGGTNMQR